MICDQAHFLARQSRSFKSLHKLSSSGRERREAGQTLLDGPHLLRAFMDAGGKPEHLLVNEAALQNAEIIVLLEDCADVAQTQLTMRCSPSFPNSRLRMVC